MLARNLVLSQNGGMIYFKGLRLGQINFGLTTVRFGDCRMKNIINGQADLLMKQLNAEQGVFLKPAHGIKISVTDNDYDVSFNSRDDGLIYQPEDNNDCLGLFHCSWLNLKENFACLAATDFIMYSGCQPADIQAVIYSGICPHCYEVGPDLYEVFAGYKPNRRCFTNGRIKSKFNLDLAGLIRQQLADSGLPDANIRVINLCSHCATDYDGSPLLFSDRRGEKQRNLVFVQYDSALLAGSSGNCPYLLLFAKP